MEPLFCQYFELAEMYGIDSELQRESNEEAEFADCGA